MLNKDLKSVCTYKEPRPEPLWESIAAFICAGVATLLVWLFLAVIASNAV